MIAMSLAALLHAGQPRALGSERAPVVQAGAWTSSGPEGGGSPIFADLRAPGLLYTVTAGGVFSSQDGGASWVSRSDGLVDLPLALVVGLDDPPALYGWSSLKLYRSLDGGRTWNTSDVVRRPLAVDPTSSRRVFAQGGVPFSTCTLDVSNDGAQTWTSVSPCPPDGGITSMVFDPQDPRNVYLSTDGGSQFSVFKSLDGGESWSPSGQGIQDPGVESLVVDPNDPRILYASTGITVYKTADSGATWRKASAQPPSFEIQSLALDPTNGNVYAATPDGLYRSTGADAAWGLVSPVDLSGLVIFSDPSAPFFAKGLDGPLRSDDRGVSWTDASGGLYGASIWALAVAPDGGLFAATSAKVFASQDGGRSWAKQPYSFPNGSSISDLVAASNPAVLYAATSGDGARSSTDGGASWVEVGAGLSSTVLTRLVKTPSNVLIAAGTTGLYELNPGGVWIRDGFFGDAGITALAASPSSDGVVYAGTFAGVFRSADAGTTWSTAQPDPGTVNALAVDPNDARVLYVVIAQGSRFAGFQKSTDSGQTWSAVGLGGGAYGCLAVDPSDSEVVYACSGFTLFRSPDGGQTWSRFDQGIAYSPSISRVVIDPDGKGVHLATFGQSVLDRVAGRTTRELSRPGLPPLR